MINFDFSFLEILFRGINYYLPRRIYFFALLIIDSINIPLKKNSSKKYPLHFLLLGILYELVSGNDRQAEKPPNQCLN